MGVQIYDLSGSLCLESGAGSQLSDQIILELSNISILNSNIIIINGEITTYNSSSDTIYVLKKIKESYLELHLYQPIRGQYLFTAQKGFRLF